MEHHDEPSVPHKVMDDIIDKSIKANTLIRVMLSPELKETEVIKNFIMWTLIAKTGPTEVCCKHKVHSSWDSKDPKQVEILTRGILTCLISKIGIRRIEEILTELRIGGKIDDDEKDRVN